MERGIIRNAFSKVRYITARLLHAGKSTKEKVEKLKESLANSKNFSEEKPPVVGIFLSSTTLLLTGKARKEAAALLGIEVPVYPIEEKALAVLLEEGLLSIPKEKLEAAVALLVQRGFGTTAELLAEDLLPSE